MIVSKYQRKIQSNKAASIVVARRRRGATNKQLLTVASHIMYLYLPVSSFIIILCGGGANLCVVCKREREGKERVIHATCKTQN